MKFDIKQEGGKVIVEVELPHQRRTGKIVERRRMQTADVLTELESRGIKHGKAIQTSNIKNWREHTRRGTWVFEEKDTKTLDKPAEKVILEVEKEETIAKKPKAKSKVKKKDK